MTEINFQYTLYKVGRTRNVYKRLYEWDKQCKNRPELIETFPKLESFNKLNNEFIKDQSEINKCKYVSRAERLIHIELNSRFKADTKKCNNCGRIHQEWFKVPNLNTNDGWNEIRQIIVHWISYIDKVYN